MVEQALLTANDAMITPLSLLTEVDVLVELLLRGERDGIHALQAIVRSFTEPVGGRVAHDLETLNQFGGRDMRASA